MLQHCDTSTLDSLHSFHRALQTAQAQLEEDEGHLSSATLSLDTLVKENEAIRSSLTHISGKQKRDALEGERLKLEAALQRGRDELQSRQQQVEALRQPRLTQQTACEQMGKDLQHLRRQYLQRAARVHLAAAQLLQPSESIEYHERLRRKAQDDVAALQNTVDGLQAEAAAARAALQQKKEVRYPSSRAAQVTMTTTTTGAGSDLLLDEEAAPAEVEDDTKDTTTNPSAAASAAAVPSASSCPPSTHECFEAVAARYQREIEEQQVAHGRKQSARQHLTATVKELCRGVEEMDARCREAQHALEHQLNESAAGAGTTPSCCSQCQCDILSSFTLS